MKELSEILDNISLIVDSYESGKFISLENLRIINRQLSCNIYYLTKHNIDAFEKHNSIVYNETTSNAKAVVKANEEVTELRMTRKILEAAKAVSISLNNELGIMKRDN